MPALNRTAAVIDRARRSIAKIETHIAKFRRASETFDPAVLNTQILAEMTVKGLKYTRQRIEKSREVIVTSQALLKQIEASEKYWAKQTPLRNELIPRQSRSVAN